MALQADVREGPTQAYIKVVDADKRTKPLKDIDGNVTGSTTYMVYEVAVYASEADRRADSAPWKQRLSAIHVDRFKIRDYTGTDDEELVPDAYAQLKTQSPYRVSNMRDV